MGQLVAIYAPLTINRLRWISILRADTICSLCSLDEVNTANLLETLNYGAQPILIATLRNRSTLVSP